MGSHVRNPALLSRRTRNALAFGVSCASIVLAVLAGGAGLVLHRAGLAAPSLNAASPAPGSGAASRALPWQDSLGDGLPDSDRLHNVQDRENFTRWFTFLGETPYYAPTPRTRAEVHDCAALVRFAYRNALAAHSPAWRADTGLPFDPGFGDVAQYHYPDGPLGQSLFRTRPGPLTPGDLGEGAFAEFADSATLLRYNTFFVSRDLRAAQPGDLLFFHQPVQREPFHTMLFVGKSCFQPLGTDWIVYHTGDIQGRPGQVREVEARTLLDHPDFRWRPLVSNPSFLGVYRLNILR